MPSILIFGSNKEARNKKLNSLLKGIDLEVGENNPDLFSIEKPKNKNSIGIKQARDAIRFLTKRPFSHKYKAVVIREADLLTIPAQNALLKTLEESHATSYIILSTKTEDSLLETVISRCKRIKVIEEKALNKIEINIDVILSETKGERLSRVDKISKKETPEILLLLGGWILQLRKNLSENNAGSAARNIELISKTLKDLEQTNLNTKLALETLFLKLE